MLFVKNSTIILITLSVDTSNDPRQMDPKEVVRALLSDFNTIEDPVTLLRRTEFTIIATLLCVCCSSLLLKSHSRDVSSRSVDTHHPATAPITINKREECVSGFMSVSVSVSE